MKNTLRTILAGALACATCLPAFAQKGVQEYTRTYYRYNVSKKEFLYGGTFLTINDKKGQPVKEWCFFEMYGKKDTTGYNSWDYTPDAQGHARMMRDGWVRYGKKTTRSRDTTVYRKDSSILKEVFYRWDDAAGQWQLTSGFVTEEKLNSAGKPISALTTRYEDGVISSREKLEYTYNNKYRLLKSELYWHNGDSWELSIRDEFTYNSKGQCTRVLTEEYMDGMAEVYVQDSLEYSAGANPVRTKVVEGRIYYDGNIDYSSRTLYQPLEHGGYMEKKQLRTEDGKSWEPYEGRWKKKDKYGNVTEEGNDTYVSGKLKYYNAYYYEYKYDKKGRILEEVVSVQSGDVRQLSSKNTFQYR